MRLPTSRNNGQPWPGATEGLALFVVLALAVAQPLFDQLGKNPEFLWLHGVRGPRLWAFTLGVFVGLPAVLIALIEIPARLVRPWRRYGYALGLWLGLVLMALVVLRRFVLNLAASVSFTAAAAGATLGVFAYFRFKAARELVRVLSVLVWAVPILFLVRGAQRETPHEPLAVPRHEGSPPPVVLVVWDELPVSTLLNDQGAIDSSWFPGFARLASTATWYRDTLTTSTLTLDAIPTLIGGRMPEASGQGGLHDPRTIFRLLEGTHERLAHSDLRGVVPHDTLSSTWVDDLRLLYLHLTMPRSIRDRLPPVGAAWGGFAQQADKVDWLEDFIGSIEAPASGDSRPLFLYLHSLLPHHPWAYLPSGTRYWSSDRLVAPGFSGAPTSGLWAGDPWLVAQAYQRHVLQTMLVDRLLSQLIERLDSLNLWDASLVIVTADHGASFTPGSPLRRPTRATVAEAAAVPLLVKLPGQAQARIDDRLASTLDVLPTIADALGIEVPWPTKGRSLIGQAATSQTASRRRVVHHEEFELPVSSGVLAEIQRIAQTRRHLFSRLENGRRDPFRIGPYASLVGQPLSSLDISPGSTGAFAERIDPKLDGNGGREAPARLSYSLVGFGSPRPQAFAVAVGQEVVATTIVLPANPTLETLLPERAAAWEDREVRLLQIAAAPGVPLHFEELPSTRIVYRLDESAAGDWVVADGGERWRVDPKALRGEVHRYTLETLPLILAWSIDDREQPPERMVVFAEGRSLTWARPGVPQGGFLDHLSFSMPEDRVFYLPLPSHNPELRFFVLGRNGRATELPVIDE